MPEETVKVVVRVRPVLEKQSNKSISEMMIENFLSYDLCEKQIILDNSQNDQRMRKIFCFDDIFTEESNQEEVYSRTCQKLVGNVVEGYNGTIFAYGQTGSGKTYSMMGRDQQQKGMIPRCFQSILQLAKSTNSKDFLIMCSFIELYNEEIRDLLSSNIKQKMQLRESPEHGIFIKDLKKLPVTSQEQMIKYLKIGNTNRTTAQTSMNTESSRSHLILTIYVESMDKADGEKLIGSKFNLVDLAGSERQSKSGTTGDRFLEATKINLSLTALGKVITSLIQGKGSFIPYRDSKLTRLLQDSLGGNAKTIMFATVSPLMSNFDETVSTLKYASRAKYITNAPVINRDPKDALILEYENEIKRLRIQLQQIKASQNMNIDQLKEQNQKLAKLAQDQKKQLQKKIKSLEEKMISPHEISQQLIDQRNRREQKLSYMERNYKKLEDQVKEMRDLLTQLRRKYKNASKQICQLENQHEREREQIQMQYENLAKQNVKFRSVLNILFTQKQLNNLISLGSWEDEQNFKLPTFYFKDRHTLAFPCGEQDQSREKQKQKDRQTSSRKTNLMRTFNNQKKR